VIFPEGTRSAYGQVGNLQPGIAAMAARSRLPVVPVVTDSGRLWGRRAFRKRPGELHWSLGLVIPTFEGSDSSGTPVGLSTQLFYEIEHFNLGVEALFGSNRGLTAGGLFFQGNWLPIDGEVSPYIGVGLGYMGADANWGLGLKVQVGVEALRLHQVRVLAGFEALIPFFDTSEDAFDSGTSGNPSRSFLPMLFLQFSL